LKQLGQALQSASTHGWHTLLNFGIVFALATHGVIKTSAFELSLTIQMPMSVAHSGQRTASHMFVHLFSNDGGR
jgi:hypothetical protein